MSTNQMEAHENAQAAIPLYSCAETYLQVVVSSLKIGDIRNIVGDKAVAPCKVLSTMSY
jgi:hypothetical protein